MRDNPKGSTRKKMISLILTLAMTLSLLGGMTAAAWAETYTYDDNSLYSELVDSNGYLTISSNDKVVINGGTFADDFIQTTGTLEINEGTFTCAWGPQTFGGSLSIKGGTFAYYNQDAGISVIEGGSIGTFDAMNGVYDSDNLISFTEDAEIETLNVYYFPNDSFNSIEVTIADNASIGAINLSNSNLENFDNDPGLSIVINGGRFGFDPSALISTYPEIVSFGDDADTENISQSGGSWIVPKKNGSGTPTSYNLTVGGIAVTSAKTTGAGWSYSAQNNTLTLNGFTYTGQGEYSQAIVYEGTSAFNIVLSGSNGITGCYDGIMLGSWSNMDNPAVTISGSGSLTMAQMTDSSTGIESVGPLTISGGSITITADNFAISCYNQLTINNGTLTCSTNCDGINAYAVAINGGTVKSTGGTANGIQVMPSDSVTPCITINGGSVEAESKSEEWGAGLYCFGNITITSGTVTGKGILYGIQADSSSLIVNGGSVTAIASSDSAISGTVKNSIAGTGWNNAAGTGNGTSIAANASGATLSYKKVVFGSSGGGNTPTPAHVHSFEYSASGASITADCSANNCTLENSKVTVTIVKPALTVCGGTGSASATLSNLDAFNAATGLSLSANDIAYEGDGYEESSTAPTGAGIYTASIETQDVTASVIYEIAKADPTITLTAKEAVYNGQDISIDAAATSSDSDEISYTYYSDSACQNSVDVHKNAGDYYVKATVAECDNYNSKTSDAVKLTIKKSPVKISGICAESKMAGDAETAAELLTSSAVMTGVYNDEVTFTAAGTFPDLSVGEKTVSITTTLVAINGGSLGNYELSDATQKEATAYVMAATVTAPETSGEIAGDAISTEMSPADQAKAQAAADKITTTGGIGLDESDPNASGVSKAAEKVASDQNAIDNVKSEAQGTFDLNPSDSAISIVPRLNLEVEDVKASGGSITSMRLDITAFADLVASARAAGSSDAYTNQTIGQIQLEVNGPITFSVDSPWPTAWAEHEHNGQIYWYQGVLEALTGMMKFQNPNGLSIFTLYETYDSVAYIKNNGAKQFYDSLIGAIDDIASADEAKVYVTTDAAATVSKAVTFTLVDDGGTGTITIGSGYRNNGSGNEYIIVADTPSGGDSTGGGSSAATAKVPASVEKGAEFKVTVPAGKTEEISITVNGANSGTVLYAVAADGTKTLIKDTALKDGKLVAKVSGTTTFVVEDNAKSFDDVHPLRWSKKAVDFVSARELFNGTGDKTFGPDETMTRGMLMTVLARLDGADAGGAGWLKKGMDWSIAKGISDGSDPDRPITREEIVTMLWRYAGSPAAGAQAAESLKGRPDGSKVNDWAQAAMAWALEVGVLNGDENGYLNPAAPATREEVAQFIMNFVCR